MVARRVSTAVTRSADDEWLMTHWIRIRVHIDMKKVVKKFAFSVNGIYIYTLTRYVSVLDKVLRLFNTVVK